MIVFYTCHNSFSHYSSMDSGINAIFWFYLAQIVCSLTPVPQKAVNGLFNATVCSLS